MSVRPQIPVTVTLLFLALCPAFAVPTAPPERTATIVVRGFDQQGASTSGEYGVDKYDQTVADLAGSLGLPLGIFNPQTPNQAAYADYYGDQFPPYYTQADKDELLTTTQLYGGGIPRYALIMAKYAREVMERSGAQQVNLLGVSMGGLVSRWMVEKDVGGLVSSGKVARWISIEGVNAGNWAASEGGETLRNWMEDVYDLDPIDLEHMTYNWIDNHIHDPHYSVDNPLMGLVQVHFWVPSDDDYNGKALTLASSYANDGVQLLRDEFFLDTNMTPQSKYLGRMPTRSAVHATHETSKDNLGLRVGAAADLLGRRRVTVTLDSVRILDDHEESDMDDGEFVFGLRVYSPRSDDVYGISGPIQDLRYEDNNVPYFELPSGSWRTTNLTWFDDMILPGEQRLVLQTDVHEIDYDLLYDISEDFLNPEESLDDTTFDISTLTSGTYSISTSDWLGQVTVTVHDYPAYQYPPSQVALWKTDAFSSDITNPVPGGTTGWTPLSGSQTGQVTDYDAGNQALRVTISSGTGVPRVNGWVSANSEWLPSSSIDTGKFVRAKFHVFRAGQADPENLNQVPNLRMRVAARFAINSMLEVFNHLAGDTVGTNAGRDICPSGDPVNPSIYRVDLDPIDVPALYVAGEGISRAFEAYSLENQENGSIELTESSIGTYAAALVPDSGAAVLREVVFQPSASDAGNLKVFNSATDGPFFRKFVLTAPGILGSETALDGVSDPTYAEGSAGVTLGSLVVATNRVGIASREFTELGTNSARMRVEPLRQYKIRWHVTSATNANRNPQLRLRARSLKFMWSQKLEIGGALAAGNSNNAIAQQALPGGGSANPDQQTPGENGGWYSLLLNTPITPDIRLAQPYLVDQPTQGDSFDSIRDIKFGFDLIDTLSGMASSREENGEFSVDRVVVRSYEVVPD